MQQENNTLNTYPEGYQEVVDALFFLPEELREMLFYGYLESLAAGTI